MKSTKRFMLSLTFVLALFSLLLPVNAAQQSQTMPAIWCHDFTSTMKIGDSGTDVAALNIALASSDKHGPDYGNSYYGEATASAVSGFQEKYRSELLDPYGLEHGTGYVSKATVEKLNELYGCTQNSNLPPVIYSTGGPGELDAGETGTWSISAEDPESGPLMYSVSWGDAVYGAKEATEKPASGVSQSAAFTHSYANPGTYTITFTVTDDAGLSAKSTITVAVQGGDNSKTGSATITVLDNSIECMQACRADEYTNYVCPPCEVAMHNAKVSVYGENGAYYGTKATDSGAAAFYSLPYGKYTAVASAPGYTTAISSFKIAGSSMLYESIYLERQWRISVAGTSVVVPDATGVVESVFGTRIASVLGAISG